MKKAIQVIEGFFESINRGDFEAARSFMSDDHKYRGPMFSTNNPKEYFENLMGLEMQFHVETIDLIPGENAVTHVSRLDIVAPVKASIPCCEVFNVEGDKIVQQRFFFDTALWPQK